MKVMGELLTKVRKRVWVLVPCPGNGFLEAVSHLVGEFRHSKPLCVTGLSFVKKTRAVVPGLVPEEARPHVTCGLKGHTLRSFLIFFILTQYMLIDLERAGRKREKH